MDVRDALQLTLIIAGACFFVIGSLGLLRFPDVYTRIHALTKADNLGLGLIVLGLLPGAGSLTAACKLLLIWFLALTANGCSGYLVARAARRRGVVPWSKSDVAAEDK
jgi:multicomponent Na+:H+ antiporter subunit G